MKDSKDQKSTVDDASVHSVVIRHWVYVAWDSHGNVASSVVDEPSDTIQLCGLKSAEGENLYFESDAYHAGSWCRENGIGFKCEERQFEFAV